MQYNHFCCTQCFLDFSNSQITVYLTERSSTLTKCGIVIKCACFPNICKHFCEGQFLAFFLKFQFQLFLWLKACFQVSVCLFEMPPPFAPQAKGGNREAAMNSAIKQIIQALHTNWTFSCVTKHFESVFCNVPGFIFIAVHPGYPIGKIINTANLICYCYLACIVRTITDNLKWMKGGLIV